MLIKSFSLKRSDRSVSSWFPVVQSIFTFNSLIYLEIILVIDGGIKDPQWKGKEAEGEARGYQEPCLHCSSPSLLPVVLLGDGWCVCVCDRSPGS